MSDSFNDKNDSKSYGKGKGVGKKSRETKDHPKESSNVSKDAKSGSSREGTLFAKPPTEGAGESNNVKDNMAAPMEGDKQENFSLLADILRKQTIMMEQLVEASRPAVPGPVATGSAQMAEQTDQASTSNGANQSSVNRHDSDYVQVEFDEILASDSEANDLDSDLDDDLAGFFDLGPDKCSANINSKKLEDFCNAGMRILLKDDKLKELEEKYFRPGNCNHMQTPKVNPEIWIKLKQTTKQGDLRMQRLHSLLLKASFPLVRILDLIMTSKLGDAEVKGMMKGIKDLAKDSLTLLLTLSTQIGFRRRELIKPDLNFSFRQLCGSHNAITDFLFGDDLAKQIRDISDAQKVGQRMVPLKFRGSSFRGGNARVQPYRRGASGRGSSRPFLRGQSQGRRPWQPGKRPE